MMATDEIMPIVRSDIGQPVVSKPIMPLNVTAIAWLMAGTPVTNWIIKNHPVKKP